jgi:hypothetical protein
MQQKFSIKTAETLVFDKKSGVYKLPHEVEGNAKVATFSPNWVISTPQYEPPKETVKPTQKTWRQRNTSAFAYIATDYWTIGLCVIISVVAHNPLPLSLPLLGVVSALLDWQSASATSSPTRRRKGRTDLPLSDIATGEMTTRFNH